MATTSLDQAVVAGNIGHGAAICRHYWRRRAMPQGFCLP